MKIYILLTFLFTSIVSHASDLPSEYIQKNDDGSIKLKGIYERNESGQVIKYTVYDGKGELLYIEVPYYSEDKRIIRADTFNSDKTLKNVAVFLENLIVILNPNGEILETQPYSEKEFLKHTLK